MKLEFTRREPGNTRLILVFSGWSTSASLYADIIKPGWDTAVVTDYSDINFPEEALTPYTTVYLYCWSMGVWAASRVVPTCKITMAFAVNGTEHPIDDQRGIPGRVFRGTADTLNERNLMKFRRRMVGDSGMDIETLSKDSASVVHLKKELETILFQIDRFSSNSPIHWRRVYIGKSDLIFPSNNQRRAWEEVGNRCGEIYESNDPHYISMKRIVDTTIPDIKKVGQRFEDSSGSYDSNATAQAKIARRLTEFIRNSHVGTSPSILEIGQGTGLFTKMYGKIVKPRRVEFVDIYPTPHFHIADDETYHVTDAEIWMEKQHSRYDLIVSASTIQWFRNPERFFENSSRLLNKDGVLVCSTFLPGTLAIFDRFRPSPMLYHKKEDLMSFARNWFEKVEEEELNIELKFSDAKQALLHLRHTGVGGSFGRFGLLREVIEAMTSDKGEVKLDFHALCLKASSG